MRKQQLPPADRKLVNKNGIIDPIWLRWLQNVSRELDNRKRPADVTYTSDATLTTDDYGKIHLFDCSSSDLTCTLMTASSTDIDAWLTIIRTGTNKLSIYPENTARIEYGSLGGKIQCNEIHRAAANISLQLVTTTQWAITSAMGLWTVR